jgi:hypothetical protein
MKKIKLKGVRKLPTDLMTVRKLPKKINFGIRKIQ